MAQIRVGEAADIADYAGMTVLWTHGYCETGVCIVTGRAVDLPVDALCIGTGGNSIPTRYCELVAEVADNLEGPIIKYMYDTFDGYSAYTTLAPQQTTVYACEPPSEEGTVDRLTLAKMIVMARTLCLNPGYDHSNETIQLVLESSISALLSTVAGQADEVALAVPLSQLELLSELGPDEEGRIMELIAMTTLQVTMAWASEFKRVWVVVPPLLRGRLNTWKRIESVAPLTLSTGMTRQPINRTTKKTPTSGWVSAEPAKMPWRSWTRATVDPKWYP